MEDAQVDVGLVGIAGWGFGVEEAEVPLFLLDVYHWDGRSDGGHCWTYASVCERFSGDHVRKGCDCGDEGPKEGEVEV